MVESEYERLLQELIGYVKDSGSVSADDLLKWSSEKKVGALTLFLLVRDAIEEGELEGQGGDVILDKDLGISIPQTLSVKRRGAEPEREEVSEEGVRKTLESFLLVDRETHRVRPRASQRTRRRLRRRVPPSTSIVAFLREEAVEERTQQAPTVTTPPKQTESVEAHVGEELEEVSVTRLEQTLGRDVVKAIEYLSEYWSVGEIRFLQDLKRQGIKDPGSVLKKLLDLGYVERTRLGVINATPKMPRLRPKSYLSDLV